MKAVDFPGIEFRSGPTGRRAGLTGGPDVWEVVRDLQGAEAAGAADPIGHVSSVTGMNRDAVERAARYYAAHPHEIDARIRMSREAARIARRD